MSARAEVDDPRFDATPGAGDHQPALLDVLGDTACVVGTCGHQGPPLCPTTAVKVCRVCTMAEVELGAPVEAWSAAAMRWPCPVARTGGAQ